MKLWRPWYFYGVLLGLILTFGFVVIARQPTGTKCSRLERNVWECQFEHAYCYATTFGGLECNWSLDADCMKQLEKCDESGVLSTCAYVWVPCTTNLDGLKMEVEPRYEP